MAPDHMGLSAPPRPGGSDEDGLTMRFTWIDEFGRYQETVAVTTQDLDHLNSRAAEMRHSMNLYFISLGWQLLDVQIEVPDRRVIVDRRRLARGAEDRRDPESSMIGLLPAEDEPRPSGTVVIRDFGKRPGP